MDPIDLRRIFARFVKKRDPKDLAVVFDAASPKLYRLALHLCGSAVDAEDLLQTTFLVVIESAESWDKRQGVLPWMTGILANRARNLHRKQAKMQSLPKGEMNVSVAPSFENRDTMHTILEEIDRLPESERRIVILASWYGMKPAEIAHVLDETPGAIRVRLHRGLKKLRLRLPAELAVPSIFLAFVSPGLAQVRQHVMAKAITFSLGPTTLSATGALLMTGTQKTGLTAAAILISLFLFNSWTSSAPDEVLEGAPESVRVQSNGARRSSDNSEDTSQNDEKLKSQNTEELATPAFVGSHRFTVLVLDARTEEPIDHALMVLQPARYEEPLALERFKRGFQRPETENPDFEKGLTATTNKHGSANLPAVTKDQRLFVKAPGLWSQVWIGAESPQPFVVRLKPDATFEVEVVDQMGRPQVGVPIRFGHKLRRNQQRIFFSRMTADAGVARIKHFQNFTHINRPGLYVELGFPVKDAVRVEFDYEKIPESPIRLILPMALKKLEVEVRDENNKLCTDAFFVGIGSNYHLGRPPRGPDQRFQWQEGKSGRTHFTHVEAGAAFEIVVQFMNHLRPPIAKVVTKANNSNQAQKIVIQAGRKHGRFRCTFLDPSGLSIKRKRIFVRRQDTTIGQFTGANQILTTDDLGQCEVILHGRFPGKNLERLIFSTPDPQTSTTDRRDLVAEVNVTPFRPLQQKTIDLGPITLARTKFVVAGKVVDEKGAPIQGAKLNVESWANGYWEMQQWGQLNSDEEGQFSVYAQVGDVKLRLVSAGNEHKGFLKGGSLPFERGADDIIVVLQQSWGLEGSILLPRGIDGRSFLVWLDGNNLDPRTASLTSHGMVKVDSNGRFKTGNLRAGTVQVSIHLNPGGFGRRHGTPLLRIKNVVIPPSAVSHDKRLQSIDLRERVASVTIRVVDQEDKPIANAILLSRPMSTETGSWLETIVSMDGKAKLIRGEEPLSIRGGKKGFTETRIESVVDSAQLVLRRSGFIRIHVNEDMVRVDAPMKLLLSVIPVAEPILKGKSGSSGIDISSTFPIGSLFVQAVVPGALISAPIPRAGQWEIQVFVSNEVTQRRESILLQRIDIQTAVDDVDFQLPLMNDKIQQAIVRLQ